MWLVRRAYEHFELVFTLTSWHCGIVILIKGDLKKAYRSHGEELFKREYKPGNL